MQMNPLEFKGYIILNFEDIRSQIKELTKLVAQKCAPAAKTVRNESRNAVNQDELQELDSAMAGLPAISLDAWKCFEKKLRTDKVFALAVANSIKDQCQQAKDLGDFLRMALGMVLTNTLASEFSWGGRRKQPFHNTKFVKLLEWVLKKHMNFARQRFDVKIVVANWLRLAGQRSGGRNFSKYQKISSKRDEQDNTPVKGRKRMLRTSTPQGKGHGNEGSPSNRNCVRKLDLDRSNTSMDCLSLDSGSFRNSDNDESLQFIDDGGEIERVPLGKTNNDSGDESRDEAESSFESMT